MDFNTSAIFKSLDSKVVFLLATLLIMTIKVMFINIIIKSLNHEWY